MLSGAQIVLSTAQLVLAGIGIGLLMAAPIGPVNILVIQRAVSRGFWGGLAAGLGAVIGDGMLAAIATFSVTAISDMMIAYAGWIQFVGGGLLIAFGTALLFAPPAMITPLGEKSHLGEHAGQSRIGRADHGVGRVLEILERGSLAHELGVEAKAEIATESAA